jgi:hypothetical protein
LRTYYQIPEAYKTEADLLNADEVNEPAEKFISFYSAIIENSDTRYQEILHEKATELYGEGVRASQVKVMENISNKIFSSTIFSFSIMEKVLFM